MKKIVAALFLGILVLGAVVMAKMSFVRGETMSEKDVCQKWGEKELDLVAFKNGSYVVRASMACSLLKNQKSYFNLKASEVEKAFGEADGYYFSDYYASYIIQRGKDHSEDTWQIVFLINGERKTSEIAVHKNCCNR
jgi:hypothetical protein